MAVSRSYADGLRIAVTVAFVFCLMFLPPEPAQGLGLSSNRQQQQKKTMVMGSKPPCCVNKCFSCRPCMATLVVPSDQKKSLTFKALSHGDNDDNGGYYLLSWKCKCGDKLFQP